MRPWEEFVPAQERMIYEKSGYGMNTIKMGKNPAVLVIDVTQSFTGGAGPGQQEDYETVCDGAWQAVGQIAKVLHACRDRKEGIPIVYTTGNRTMEKFYGGATKRPRSKGDQKPFRDEIPIMIAPCEQDLVLRKNKASAFFDTPLASYLHRLQVDSLLIMGTSTSGCVRATVVDAFSHNFKTFVVEEATFDRSPTLHLANLFDMNAKYAEVITVNVTLSLITKGRDQIGSRAEKKI